MPDWIVQVLGMAGAAVGIYAGIRADLASIREKADQAHSSAESAHRRIDDVFNRRRG